MSESTLNDKYSDNNNQRNYKNRKIGVRGQGRGRGSFRRRGKGHVRSRNSSYTIHNNTRKEKTKELEKNILKSPNQSNSGEQLEDYQITWARKMVDQP